MDDDNFDDEEDDDDDDDDDADDLKQKHGQLLIGVKADFSIFFVQNI